MKEKVSERNFLKRFQNIDLEILTEYQDKQMELIKNRSDYEKFSKFIINDKKSSLHSTVFRADYSNNQKDLREIQRAAQLRRLKLNQSEYSKRTHK